MWFTVQEWESLGEHDIVSAPPLNLGFGILRAAEAIVDVVAVTACGRTGPARVSARVAILGAMAVQLAYVRTDRVEGVRLVIFPLGALAEELADLVPVSSTAPAHPARHYASYPYELFLAGLAAALSGPGVLAEVCVELARATSIPASDAARQLTHLAQDCDGRLEALVTLGRTLAPASSPERLRPAPIHSAPLSWTQTTSGWFALTPASSAGFLRIDVRPVAAADLAAQLMPALGRCLAAR